MTSQYGSLHVNINTMHKMCYSVRCAIHRGNATEPDLFYSPEVYEIFYHYGCLRFVE